MLEHRIQSYTKSSEKCHKENVTIYHVCENVSCKKRAVVQETTSKAWLCQSCLDLVYDALWGLGT